MLSNEEKKAIKEVKHFNELTRYWQEEEYEEKEIARYIRTILNLIEKQSKEIEEYKKELDLDNECEIALNSKVMDLEKEIEELKEKCKEVICIPEGTCFMLEPKDVDKKVEDKIKAKIEPVLKQLERKMQEEYNHYGNSREYQDIVDAYNFLQSLLEKE